MINEEVLNTKKKELADKQANLKQEYTYLQQRMKQIEIEFSRIEGSLQLVDELLNITVEEGKGQE